MILAEISAHHLKLKSMDGHFGPMHPYIESTIVLSDIQHKIKISSKQQIILPFSQNLLLYLKLLKNFILFPAKLYAYI